MLLKDIFNQLEHGELKGLSLGGSLDAGGITTENQIRPILSYINLALTAIHKRFPIKVYPVNYIPTVDTLEVNLLDTFFEGKTSEFLKLDNVRSVEDSTIRLNDTTNEDAPYLLNEDTLIFPESAIDKEFVLHFRANHPFIDYDENLGENGFDSSAVDIKLSVTYLEPLLYFVGSRAVASNKTLEDGTNESNLLLQKYENACRVIENRALINKDDSETNKLDVNGWK